MRLVSLAISCPPLPGPWNVQYLRWSESSLNVGTSHVGSFGLRDFLQLSAEILPTLSLFGLPEPDLIPAVFSAELLPAESW